MSIYNKHYLQKFIPIASGMQKYLGDSYEFIIHDVSEPESSIIFISGNLTGRKIGNPVTNIIIEAINKYGNNAEDMIGYQVKTSDGRTFKSSTIFIRDGDGVIVGCLCINMNIDPYLSIEKLISAITQSDFNLQEKSKHSEVFANDIQDVVHEMVGNELASKKVPTEKLNKADKINLVITLEEKGVFGVKGSVEIVAQELDVSVYTIYNYLKEIRGSKLETTA